MSNDEGWRKAELCRMCGRAIYLAPGGKWRHIHDDSPDCTGAGPQ